MNPFDAELDQLNSEHKGLVREADMLGAELELYAGFDLDETHARLLRMQREAESVRQNLALQEPAARELEEVREAALRDMDAGGVLRYLHAPYKLAKRVLADADEKIAALLAKRRPLVERLEQLTAAQAEAEKAISGYCSFDQLRAQAIRNGKLHEAEVLMREIGPLAAKKMELDARLAVTCQELDKRRKRYGVVASELARAQSHQNALDNARSGAERAPVHAQAERDFPGRSLKTVIRDARREQADLERQIAKLNEEVATQVRWASMDIRTVYLDGSNLCNAAGKFLGAQPLVMLVDALAHTRNVKLCFDHGIGRMLGMPYARIRALFPKHIAIEFIDREATADRYFLMPASDDPHACVISNDRFTDHGGLEVVEQKRVLRARFVFGMLHVDELNVHIRYKDAEGEAVA
jgi:hypothetical protein